MLEASHEKRADRSKGHTMQRHPRGACNCCLDRGERCNSLKRLAQSPPSRPSHQVLGRRITVPTTSAAGVLTG
jgi:hypothetical protein